MTAIDDPVDRMQAVLDEYIADGRLSAPHYAEADVTAILAEVRQLREYVVALNEAQVGLQTSAFKAGWWTCRNTVTTSANIRTAEMHALDYAEQVRAVTVAEPNGAQVEPGVTTNLGVISSGMVVAGTCLCGCPLGQNCRCGDDVDHGDPHDPEGWAR